MSQSAEREPSMSTVSDKPRTTTSGFTARVDGAHLADLIQMSCQNRVRCVFRIVSGDEVGYLFFDDGKVLHAELGARTGMEAMITMLGLDTGTFEPSEREWPAQPSLEMPPDVLLLNAAKHLDEASEQKRREAQPSSRVVKLPSVAAPPRASKGAPPREASPASSEGEPEPQRAASARPKSGGAEGLASSSNSELPMVHLGKDGELVAAKGQADETLVEATAFAHRLASLAGEALGLGPCRATYLTGPTRAFLAFEAREDAIVGAAGSIDQLAYLAKRAGV